MEDKKNQSDERNNENDNPSYEQNKREKPVSQIGKVITTGFIGGVFWSFLAYLSSLLNFTEISPNLILQPIVLGDWKNGTVGEFVSIGLIGILSIGVALVYYAILKKVKTMWMGIVFGAVLWGIVFFILNPMFPNLKTVFELQRATIVTTVCLYILYGFFVGYSISFDYNELNTNNEN